jgi:hypothetical protein
LKFSKEKIKGIGFFVVFTHQFDMMIWLPM